MSAESAHLSTFGAKTEAEIQSTSISNSSYNSWRILITGMKNFQALGAPSPKSLGSFARLPLKSF